MVHKNYILLAKLSTDQVLKKAKLHAKKNRITGSSKSNSIRFTIY